MNLEQCKKFAAGQTTLSQSQSKVVHNDGQTVTLAKQQNMQLTINDASELTTNLCVDVTKKLIQNCVDGLDQQQTQQSSTFQFSNVTFSSGATTTDPVINLQETTIEDEIPEEIEVQQEEAPKLSQKKQAKADKKKEAKANQKKKAQQAKQREAELKAQKQAQKRELLEKKKKEGV